MPQQVTFAPPGWLGRALLRRVLIAAASTSLLTQTATNRRPVTSEMGGGSPPQHDYGCTNRLWAPTTV